MPRAFCGQRLQSGPQSGAHVKTRGAGRQMTKDVSAVADSTLSNGALTCEAGQASARPDADHHLGSLRLGHGRRSRRAGWPGPASSQWWATDRSFGIQAMPVAALANYRRSSWSSITSRALQLRRAYVANGGQSSRVFAPARTPPERTPRISECCWIASVRVCERGELDSGNGARLCRDGPRWSRS